MSSSTSSTSPTALSRLSSPDGKATKISGSPVTSSPGVVHPFYGHKETSLLCARFICSLFQCPDTPIAKHLNAPTPTLAEFVAYAHHRTRLLPAVTFTALVFLTRLKGRFPLARGSCGHRLFISAFIIASKICCEETYSTQSWCTVAQGMFQLEEINRMERELCKYLEYNLHVTGDQVAELEASVRAEYSPYAVVQSPVACWYNHLPLQSSVVPLQTLPATPTVSRFCRCTFNGACIGPPDFDAAM